MSHIDFVDLFIQWFPMLLLIAVWIFFMSGFGGRRSLWNTQREGLEIQRRQAEALERIAKALEKHA